MCLMKRQNALVYLGPSDHLHSIEISNVNFYLMLMIATSLPVQLIQIKY